MVHSNTIPSAGRWQHRVEAATKNSVNNSLHLFIFSLVTKAFVEVMTIQQLQCRFLRLRLVISIIYLHLHKQDHAGNCLVNHKDWHLWWFRLPMCHACNSFTICKANLGYFPAYRQCRKKTGIVLWICNTFKVILKRRKQKNCFLLLSKERYSHQWRREKEFPWK